MQSSKWYALAHAPPSQYLSEAHSAGTIQFGHRMVNLLAEAPASQARVVLEASAGFEPAVEVLQTSALPLG